MVQLVKHLSCKHKDLSSILQSPLRQPGVPAWDWFPSVRGSVQTNRKVDGPREPYWVVLWFYLKVNICTCEHMHTHAQATHVYIHTHMYITQTYTHAQHRQHTLHVCAHIHVYTAKATGTVIVVR